MPSPFRGTYETEVTFSSFTDIGTRNYQEDVLRYRCVSNRFHSFIVCDGHGGSKRCATFTADQLQIEIKTELHCAEEADRADKIRLIPLLERVVNRVVRMWDIQSFGTPLLNIQCEREREQFFQESSSLKKLSSTLSGDRGDHGTETGTMSWTDRCSGSTLTVLLIDAGSYPVRIAAAYLGDSRFAVKKDREGICFVSRDHVPLPGTLPPSVVRAYPSSHIQGRRLNGILAMTHAVGDNTEQLYGCVQRVPSTFFCTSRSNFCICLGSDGFWDVFHDAHENLAFVERGADAQRFLELRKKEFQDNASIFCITGKTRRSNQKNGTNRTANTRTDGTVSDRVEGNQAAAGSPSGPSEEVYGFSGVFLPPENK
jgi:serine/threonine protein phosphatase PrpC